MISLVVCKKLYHVPIATSNSSGLSSEVTTQSIAMNAEIAEIRLAEKSLSASIISSTGDPSLTEGKEVKNANGGIENCQNNSAVLSIGTTNKDIKDGSINCVPKHSLPMETNACVAERQSRNFSQSITRMEREIGTGALLAFLAATDSINGSAKKGFLRKIFKSSVITAIWLSRSTESAHINSPEILKNKGPIVASLRGLNNRAALRGWGQLQRTKYR
jgi:hypothetical protein